MNRLVINYLFRNIGQVAIIIFESKCRWVGWITVSYVLSYLWFVKLIVVVEVVRLRFRKVDIQ